MNELNITYSTIKEIWGSIPSYYIEQGDGSYYLYCIGDDLSIRSVVSSTEDGYDFQTFHKSVGIAAGSRDDAFVLGSLANNSKFVKPKNEHGSIVVAPTHEKIDESWRMEGHKYVADGYATSIFDVRINTQILMQGARYWTFSKDMDSYAEFSVIDKTNTLGLHTLYGLPVGTPIELKKFVRTYRLPSGLMSDAIVAPTVSPVVAGLDIRCTIVNSGPEPIHIGVNYIWYEAA